MEYEDKIMHKCGRETEVYSRVCGYFRPVSNWNKGKKEEFKERKNFDVNKKVKEGKGI
jgi:ribonucleoside-triphosphate reductase